MAVCSFPAGNLRNFCRKGRKPAFLHPARRPKRTGIRNFHRNSLALCNLVAKCLEGEEVGSFCARVTKVHCAVAANGPADTFQVGLGRAISGDDFDVPWLFFFWELMATDEPHGFGILDVVGFETLCEATNFVGVVDPP